VTEPETFLPSVNIQNPISRPSFGIFLHGKVHLKALFWLDLDLPRLRLHAFSTSRGGSICFCPNLGKKIFFFSSDFENGLPYNLDMYN